MRLKSIFTLIFIINYGLNAQITEQTNIEFKYKPPEKYFDLNNNKISKKRFFEKAKKDHIHFANYTFKDTVYYHLQLSYFFSKFNGPKKTLLFNYLSREHEVDTSKIMVIHYADSLQSIRYFPKADTIIYDDLGRHKHLYSHESFVNQNRECIKKFNRNRHSNVYHFFRKNTDHPTELMGAKWYQDKRESLFKIFNKTIKTFWSALIHPDGRYFVYNRYDTDKPKIIYEKLIKNRRWDKYYDEFMNKFKF